MVDIAGSRLVLSGGRSVSLAAPPVAGIYAAIGVVAADSSTPTLPTVVSPPSLPTVVSPPSLPTVDSGLGPPAAQQDLAAPPAAKQGPRELQGVEEDVTATFPSVLNESKELPPVRHSIQHKIVVTSHRPVTSKYRRLDPKKLAAAKAEFAAMEAQGIVRRGNGEWSSPLHMVRKSDGTWRPCGDYRLLNLATKPDLYPPPHMEDLTAKLAGCTIFSKLDLRKGYYQVPVAPEDVEKTAIVTPFGLYEFLRMPFGQRNAGQTFQRFMDQVMSGLPNNFTYLDDVMVASRTTEEHRQHLKDTLARLEEHGLVLNKQKCSFYQKQVEYLGHLVSAEGISPLPAKVKAIEEMASPTTKGGLLSFLGSVNFYRRFIRGAASILKPLTDATKGSEGRAAKLEWSADMAAAFQRAKQALVAATCLDHPDDRAEISVAVDASDHHVGAVLQQLTPGRGWRPLAFFSQKLSAAQSRYSALDRELLAAVSGIRHFRFQLEGRNFHLFTDHKPLTSALQRLSDPWTARQQRHLAYIAEYTSDVRHLPGSRNVVADMLSRPAAAVVPPSPAGPVPWAAIAAGQATCEKLAAARAEGSSSSLHLQEVAVGGVGIWCDVSTGVLRPWVPADCRHAVFVHVHSLAHAGTRATSRLVSARFVWPGLATDVKEWCRQCAACQRAKVTVQPRTPVDKIEVPAARFSHVHVDLVGPMPMSSDGYSYMLTMVDRSTRWPEATPLSNISAETVLDNFVATWVARHGVPACITTDRGTQFTSALWRSWCKQVGAKHITTTAYHPQSNGMVERLHRQLKAALKARGDPSTWTQQLPWVLLGLRAAPKDESGISSGQAALGLQLALPGQLLEQKATAPTQQQAIPATRRTYAEVASTPSPLDSADFVYVRHGGQAGPLADSYDGPFKVLARGDKVFKLQLGARVDTVSKDRLKPHLGVAVPELAVPRQRGRPPGTGGKISLQPGVSEQGGPV